MTFSLGSTPRSLVKYNDQSISAITEIASGAKDDMVLLSTTTASDASDLSITSDIDSTYPIYIIKTINLFSHTDDRAILFNFTTDGTNWNVTKTGSIFEAIHSEADDDLTFRYGPSEGGLAQGTGGSSLMGDIIRDADGCGVCIFRLYNPASTVFVKHYMADVQFTHSAVRTYNRYAAGYANTTSAITGVRFLMNTGNIDAGDFCLYGITT